MPLDGFLGVDWPPLALRASDLSDSTHNVEAGWEDSFGDDFVRVDRLRESGVAV